MAFLFVSWAVGTSLVRAEDNSIFQKPVRLQADGKDIDTGPAWGHSGPCLADVDGDGKRDLIVGDFSGKFHYYKNVGTDNEPKYTDAGYLQAGNEDAKVWIYCCIGSSPHLADFDNDGKLDLISGSYDPGECYLFRGVGSGKFAVRETLVDKNGKSILRVPDQKQKWQSFGSWPVLVDWNNDGKPDLLIGGFDGTMFVRLNEGTREKPVLSDTNIVVQAAGKDLKVPGDPAGHAAVAIADWDVDGRWDILSGSDGGSVYFFRNVGEAAIPQFEEGREIISSHHEHRGYNEIVEVGAEPTIGIRTQIFATDYNGDGKPDLLVGDFCTTITPRADLSPEARQEFESFRKQSEEVIASRRKELADLGKDFEKRFPGDAAYTDKGEAEWTKVYREMRNSQQDKELDAKGKELDAAMEKYLIKPPIAGKFDPNATNHGYVWLYLRK